jgi:hypothetical protein
MADLHWERKAAGVYETMFYCNGYRYKILKDDAYNNWRAYYLWDHMSEKKWKRLRTYSADTLKQAKVQCDNHNARPRAKWKLMGKQESGKYEGQYVYNEIDRDGQPFRYRTHFLDPVSYSNFVNDEEEEGKGEVA